MAVLLAHRRRYQAWKSSLYSTESAVILRGGVEDLLYADTRHTCRNPTYFNDTRLRIALLMARWSGSFDGWLPCADSRLAHALALSPHTVHRHLAAFVYTGLVKFVMEPQSNISTRNNPQILCRIDLAADSLVGVRQAGAGSPAGRHVEVYDGLIAAAANPGYFEEGELAAYVYLLFRARTWEGTAYPGLDNVADALRIRRPHAQRLVEGLIAKRWVRREQASRSRLHKNAGDLYFLCPYPVRKLACPEPGPLAARERRLREFLADPANCLSALTYPPYVLPGCTSL